MSHLALRNTKRGKGVSGAENKAGAELVEVLKVLISIFLTFYTWIRLSFVNIYHSTYYRISDEKLKTEPSEDEEDSELELPGTYVVAKGVGLMAAYTGRRAVFAVYPACSEGLVVKARGPAPLAFEFRKRRGLFLVGYIPKTVGTYRLRVARFGRRAIGSPFVIRVDDPPPGYLGTFGASVWHERPPPLPFLTGVVDFVTEKMFLNEEGKLLRLKGGDVQPERDLYLDKVNFNRKTKKIHKIENSKNKPMTTLDEEVDQTLEKFVAETQEKELVKPIEKNEQVFSIQNKEIPKETSKCISAKKQVVTRIENLLATVNNENKKKDPQERYKFVSKALMKELSLSLKILNMLGSSQESISPPEISPDCETKREFVIPEIRITEEMGTTAEGGRSTGEDQFLSGGSYGAQRGGKLGWHWGDDAVGDEACDSDRIRSGVLKASKVSPAAPRKVWTKMGMSGLLGLGKGDQLTGVRLLHGVYRQPECSKDKIMNNSPKARYQNIINRRNEKNNLQCCRNKPLSNEDNTRIENFPYENNFMNAQLKLNNNKRKNSKLTGSFRTLSLPDFSRIYSLSVLGLRKAKSCGDKSFKAMTSSTFSLTLKNIFDKEQVYNVSKAENSNRKQINTTNGGATLVRMTHYGSEHEKRKIQSNKSVEEWKKYWEDLHVKQSEKEFGKECSLELNGIVERGKAVFEMNSDSELSDDVKLKGTKRSKSVDETIRCAGYYGTNGYLTEDSITSPSPESNKTAFEKAKELFESSYEPSGRRRSLSERFHVSGLAEDLHNGVTPGHLGVPNRKSTITCLGSVYQQDYPHIPVTRHRKDSNENIFAWEFILQPDSSYV